MRAPVAAARTGMESACSAINFYCFLMAATQLSAVKCAPVAVRFLPPRDVTYPARRRQSPAAERANRQLLFFDLGLRVRRVRKKYTFNHHASDIYGLASLRKV
jgi:hypothetical protein